MKLHLDKKLFTQAIQFTADQLGIPAIYVEKDYWVTFALHTIFHHTIGKETVFKGGTALSKCYGMIDRFSEDIDLVVLKKDGEAANQLTNKIKRISTVVNTVLPEVTIEGLTHKMGMNRKTAHSYSKEFTGNYGQVRDAIVIEATWLGNHEPYTKRPIISMVGNMMLQNNQLNIAKKHDLLHFELNVLEPTRTLCEKIMSLVRFSYGENPLEDLKKKVRHTYDLHQILQQTRFLDFFNTPAFEEILLKVAQDDVISFKNNNKWLENHPLKALFFDKLDEIWPELKTIYNTDFKGLVYGDLPPESEVVATMLLIKERISRIKWEIIIE